jgi:hypothetical protein
MRGSDLFRRIPQIGGDPGRAEAAVANAVGAACSLKAPAGMITRKRAVDVYAGPPRIKRKQKPVSRPVCSGPQGTEGFESVSLQQRVCKLSVPHESSCGSK